MYVCIQCMCVGVHGFLTFQENVYNEHVCSLGKEYSYSIVLYCNEYIYFLLC